MSADSKVNNRK